MTSGCNDNRDLFRLFWRLKSRPRGRPRIPAGVQQLIAEMGANNHTWGEERIAAELRVKLGLTLSPRTVRRYMPSRPRTLRLVVAAFDTATRIALDAIFAGHSNVIIAAAPDPDTIDSPRFNRLLRDAAPRPDTL